MYKYTTGTSAGPTPEVLQSLDELTREGARRMIAAALELEVDAYLEQLHDAAMRRCLHRRIAATRRGGRW